MRALLLAVSLVESVVRVVCLLNRKTIKSWRDCPSRIHIRGFSVLLEKSVSFFSTSAVYPAHLFGRYTRPLLYHRGGPAGIGIQGLQRQAEFSGGLSTTSRFSWRFDDCRLYFLVVSRLQAEFRGRFAPVQKLLLPKGKDCRRYVLRRLQKLLLPKGKDCRRCISSTKSSSAEEQGGRRFTPLTNSSSAERQFYRRSSTSTKNTPPADRHRLQTV